MRVDLSFAVAVLWILFGLLLMAVGMSADQMCFLIAQLLSTITSEIFKLPPPE
jgi:hypothetical protein